MHEIFGGNVLLIFSLPLAVNRDEIIPKTKVFWVFFIQLAVLYNSRQNITKRVMSSEEM